MKNLDSILKSRDITLPRNIHLVNVFFFSSHVWMWELNHKERWAQNNWCFQTVVLEKTLESPLDKTRSNKSILKEISPEYSLEGLMLKLNLQYFGYLMQKSDSLEKTLMLGKIEGRRIRGWTEVEMVGWYYQLNGHEFQQALEVGDQWGSLVCCHPGGPKESEMTEWLNWTE